MSAPIKLTDIACLSRIDGTGQKCSEGSYLAIFCEVAGDIPQRLTFRISGGQAEVLVAEIQAALTPTNASGGAS